MRILIEGYQYNVADISSILHGIDAMEDIEEFDVKSDFDIEIPES